MTAQIVSVKYPEKKRPKRVDEPPEGYYYVGKIAEKETPEGWLCWDLKMGEQTWSGLDIEGGWPTTGRCKSFVFAAPMRCHLANYNNADMLLTEMSMVRDMVVSLNRDIDAGHEVHEGRFPGETIKGPRMTLKKARRRLHHIEFRLQQVFKAPKETTHP